MQLCQEVYKKHNMGRNIRKQAKTKTLTKTKKVKATKAMSESNKKQVKQIQTNIQNVTLNLVDSPHNQMGREIFTKSQLERVAQYNCKETRSIKRRIQFEKPYPQGTKPYVYTAIGGIDCDISKGRILIDVQEDEIDNKGFKLTVFTDRYSMIHYVNVLWFAK